MSKRSWHNCLLAAMLVFAVVPLAAAQTTKIFPSQGGQPYVVKPQGTSESLYASSAALIVSVSDYTAGSSGWHRLPATLAEMDSVKDVLVQQGFEVTRVYNPTAQSLYQEMQSFLGKYSDKANARLLFFYSGHGYTNPINQMAYVVPVDAGNPRSNHQDFISKAVTLEYFHTWVRQFKANHFMAIFDSCFSGAIFTTKSATDKPSPRPLVMNDRWRYLTGVIAKPVRQFISAGGPDEELPGKSSFVPVFVEGLRGGASSIKDGYVTGKELGIFLETVVSDKRAGKQNPVSGVSRDTNFIFGDMVFQYDSGKAAAPVAVNVIEDATKRGLETTRSELPQRETPPQVPASSSEECRLFNCNKP